MPARIASPLKQHLIAYFNRKRYYEYPCIITLVYVIFVRFVGGKDAILVKHL